MRGPADDLLLHKDVQVLVAVAGQGLGQQGSAFLFETAEVVDNRQWVVRSHAHRIMPGHHRRQGRLPGLGLLEGEPDRFEGAPGPVDPDDDPAGRLARLPVRRYDDNGTW